MSEEIELTKQQIDFLEMGDTLDMGDRKYYYFPFYVCKTNDDKFFLCEFRKEVAENLHKIRPWELLMADIENKIGKLLNHNLMPSILVCDMKSYAEITDMLHNTRTGNMKADTQSSGITYMRANIAGYIITIVLDEKMKGYEVVGYCKKEEDE